MRRLRKATVMVGIMVIGMIAMVKGHIINQHPGKIRWLKSTLFMCVIIYVLVIISF